MRDQFCRCRLMVGRLYKGYPVKDTVSILKIPCQGRDPGSNPGNDTKFRMRTANSKIQLLIEK